MNKYNPPDVPDIYPKTSVKIVPIPGLCDHVLAELDGKLQDIISSITPPEISELDRGRIIGLLDARVEIKNMMCDKNE